MKKIKLLILAVVYLGVCWGIGRYHKENVSVENVEELQDDAVEYESEVWETAVFEGNQATNDTPWNITAGWFEMEDEGECILLLPNTAAVFGLAEEEFSFLYQIHPWVKEESDGAGLIVQGYDTEGDVICEDVLEIGNQEGWIKYTLDRGAFSQAVSLKLLCNNGKNDDDNCDWVILKPTEYNVLN